MQPPLRVSILLAIALVATAWLAHPQSAVCSTASDGEPSARALTAGLAGLARHHKRVRNKGLWTLIDYDLPFTAVRLWVIGGGDDNEVLMRSRVSHAWKTGALYAIEFSNRRGSNLSSLGSYVTARRTYEGSYGHSLRVRGLDSGVNDNAWLRDIVFHPDLGMTHSAGCFMLPDATSDAIIDAIAGGTFVYVHRTER